MTFAQYAELAHKTCATLPLETHLIHMRSGVITEMSELIDAYKKHIAYGKPLDKVNIKEEIGDILWYIGSWYYVYYTKILKLDIHTDTKVPKFRQGASNINSEITFVKYLINRLHLFLEAVDDYNSYGMTAEVERRAYYSLAYHVFDIANHFEFDIEEIAKTNIAKLQARYSDKFNSDNAINRNLDAERRILES